MAKVYKDTIGLRIEVDMAEALNGAWDFSFKVKKPDGTTTTVWTSDVLGTIMFYDTIADDLDQAGEYAIQPYLKLGELNPPWTGNGDTIFLTVYENFK